ncbi:hypothetical protein A0O28_0012670 [Trichoderma guizhouense]|uniref:Uncharacterized protein n=1 Tax=Trichoderma guizhouense TaxID=1491466 RepID=A0A1T3CAL0_9HYPO|nr:hypothetical protein A0O28_0012670 [Trichoderma guizhouense]
MAQNSAINFPIRNVIFRTDDHLYEELNPVFSGSLGAFKTSNPKDDRFQRPVIHVSAKKSKFKKTVELILCCHGWKNPDKEIPMTLIVLGVKLSCHDRESRFQSVKISLRFDEDDKRDQRDAFEACPQVVAYAPFVQDEYWNITEANVTDTNGYGGKLGVDQVVQAEVGVDKSSEISYTRRHFDKGVADRLYDEDTGRYYGVEWYCEQNKLQDYGVMPNFHLAVLLERSHHHGKAISFKAEFDLQAEAGISYDIEEGLRRVYRLLRPEDDPVYFDPSKEKPDVNGVGGVGEKLLRSIKIDNLGALAEGQLLSKLIDSAGGPLAGLEPMKGVVGVESHHY